MSRIGRLPIKLNKGITAEVKGDVVTVSGPLGTLKQSIENKNIKVSVEDGVVHVTRSSEAKCDKAAHGLYRALIANMATGVEKGFEKNLVIAGVGYKAVQAGDKVTLSVGYSHPVEVVAPAGVKLTVVSPTELSVKGASKEKVGQLAADIKAIRKPEPYHGYGIRYKDETILRKAGKATGKK